MRHWAQQANVSLDPPPPPDPDDPFARFSFSRSRGGWPGAWDLWHESEGAFSQDGSRRDLEKRFRGRLLDEPKGVEEAKQVLRAAQGKLRGQFRLEDDVYWARDSEATAALAIVEAWLTSHLDQALAAFPDADPNTPQWKMAADKWKREGSLTSRVEYIKADKDPEAFADWQMHELRVRYSLKDDVWRELEQVFTSLAADVAQWLSQGAAAAAERDAASWANAAENWTEGELVWDKVWRKLLKERVQDPQETEKIVKYAKENLKVEFALNTET
mmetsp:Transcript_41156/g.88978  ORF Transcript_41156/g.88978 Transcript_41156/m.88978 type:complete len:273 (+) Transcript_41156:2-820(+)